TRSRSASSARERKVDRRSRTPSSTAEAVVVMSPILEHVLPVGRDARHDPLRKTGTCYSFRVSETTVDVLVVGAGGAGMVAALTAADQGLETLLVEKSDWFGGNTARSGGG